MACTIGASVVMSLKEKLAGSAKDFKNFLIDHISSDETDVNISQLARAVGVDPSTMNRYINSDRSHLPAYLVPFLPTATRTALLNYLDNKSGNPLKGLVDTSSLNGSVRDEVDMIVESLGMIVHLRRTEPGSRSDYAVIELFQKIRLNALRGEKEISNNG